jgi:acetolactate synthase I/II/III large subunit
MLVAEAIVKCLEQEGVEVIFGYPGGNILPVYDALRESKIKHVLVRNEQSSAHNANGYSRVSSKVGVCIATSGPGATNLITGIATAYMDSVPMVVITGQVPLNIIGTDVFQEADIIGSTEPFTKYNRLVKNKEDIPRIIKEAFHIAKTGRPGPVLIDIPKDIQNQVLDNFVYPDSVSIRGYNPVYEGHVGQIKRAVSKLKKSKRPVICAGGGVLISKAEPELKALSDELGIPVAATFMGIGSYPTNGENYIGTVGMHGDIYANKIVYESDLVIIVGSKVSDRSKLGHIADAASIIHIDIDSAEIGKNLDVDIPVVGDAKLILSDIRKRIESLDIAGWRDHTIKLKKDFKRKVTETPFVNPMEAMKFVSQNTGDDSVLVTDVGQNQFWASKSFEIYGKRKLLGSGGLGTMGYSVPAAIGAKFGSSESEVISVVGDGGIQMLLAELGVIMEEDLDIKIIVFNNSRLGMVREIQDSNYGKGNTSGVVFEKTPNFAKIAEGYNIKSVRVENNKEFEEAFAEMMKSKEAFLLEARVDSDFETL